jgi:hypothetical protein
MVPPNSARSGVGLIDGYGDARWIARRRLGFQLSAGEATREEDDYFGDPVIETA